MKIFRFNPLEIYTNNRSVSISNSLTGPTEKQPVDEAFDVDGKFNMVC